MKRVDKLSLEWKQARQDELTAKDRRERIEQQLVKLVGNKEEGSTTVNTDKFKITTVGRLNYNLDNKIFDEIIDDIPMDMRPYLVRYKKEVNLSGLKEIEKSRPDIYKTFSRALTIKPGKTGVKVIDL